jgi:predicted MFS family arabinose efflux permease
MTSLAQDVDEETSPRYEGWRVAAASGVGIFFATIPFFTFALFLKPLSEEFSWSRESVSSAFGSMTLGAALSAPIVGYLFDRFGSRWISGLCLAINACGLASLYVLTPRVWHLFGVFTLVGLATAGTSGVVYARAVSSWFERRRGAALASVLAGAAVGGIVHPPVAAALIRLVGWRGACLSLGLVSLAVGVPIVLRFVRARPAAMAHSRPVASGTTVPEALRSRVFWILITVVFGSTIALNGTIVHLSALLTDRGVPSGGAALVVSVMGAASLAGRLLTGWLLDRFAAPRVSFMLLAIAALGTFLLADARSFVGGMTAAALIGFGTGGEFDVVPYLLSRYFGLRSLSTLYGLNWTAWGMASAAGPMLMGHAFDTTGSYGTVLVGFAVGTLGAAVLMLALPDSSPSQTLRAA